MTAFLEFDELDAFYARTHRAVFVTVRKCIFDAPDELIEDACASAWEQAFRHQDQLVDHPDPFSWVCLTAKRIAWRLLKFQPQDGNQFEPAIRDTLDDEALASQIVGAIGDLKPQQQTALLSRLAGYSYKEIAEREGKTYTWVNRHTIEGWAALREAVGA